MILDQDNIFIDGQNVTKPIVSNIITNKGAGNASDPIWLIAMVAGGDPTGTIELDLRTSEKVEETPTTYNMLTPVTLGTWTGHEIKTKLPRTLRAYLDVKVKLTGFSKGKLTVALVTSVDLHDYRGATSGPTLIKI